MLYYKFKMKIKCLFLIFILMLSYGVRYESNLEENFIEKKISSQAKSEEIKTHLQEQNEADELEEDWEVYGDDRVKTDVGLRKLYRSFRSQHASGTLTMQSAFLQYKEFEKSRNPEKKQERKGNRFERISADEDSPEKKRLDKTQKVFDGLEAAGECITAFYDTFAGDFCWKRKSSLYPSMCQCGYSFYKGVCYDKCPSGYRFSRGDCISNSDGTRKRMNYVADTRNSAFLCKSGYKKENGLCKESCELYNLVDCGPAACAKDSTTCGLTIFNMVFGVFMAVFQIVISVMTIGQGGGFFKNVKSFFKDGNVLKKIWDKAKEQAKEALETLTDPEKFTEFMADYVTKVSLSQINLCGEIANGLLNKAAKGPQDVPETPIADQIMSNPLIENLPGASIASAALDVAKDCNGGSTLDCAKSVLGLVGELDPTGILGGVLSIATSFMYPGCDELEEPKSTTEEEEVQED